MLRARDAESSQDNSSRASFVYSFAASLKFAKFDFSESIFQRLFDLLNEKEAEGEALNPHDFSIYL